MDEGFFRKATPQEHEAVVNNEKKQFSLNLIVRQKPGAFSMKGTKPVFDPRKNKLDPRFYKVSNTEEYQTGDGLFTIHPESDTVIDHRLNRSPDKPDSADPENEPDKK